MDLLPNRFFITLDTLLVRLRHGRCGGDGGGRGAGIECGRMKDARDTCIVAVPYDSGHRVLRMGGGPEHLLKNGLAEELGAEGRKVRREVLHPESTPPVEVATAFELDGLVSARVGDAIAQGEFPLVLSGNCNTSVGTLAGANPEGLGIVLVRRTCGLQHPGDDHYRLLRWHVPRHRRRALLEGYGGWRAGLPARGGGERSDGGDEGDRTCRKNAPLRLQGHGSGHGQHQAGGAEGLRGGPWMV